MKQLRFATLYAAYLFAVVAAVDYVFFWRPWVAELREIDVPQTENPNTRGVMEPALARLLGSGPEPREGSFAHRPRQAPPGVSRVCAFGDSYTYGDEVEGDHSYPALLQGLLRKSGRDEVEVLNFGASWHGFHQSYLMFERLGLAYGCSTVLLGPGGFFPHRDTRFNHTRGLAPYYLHARYVLEGEDLRLVEPVGESNRERFDHYHRFVPHWRTLRYDRDPPAFLAAMIPSGRQMANPFYYRRDSEDAERFASYRILLRRFAAKAARVVLVHYEHEVLALAHEVGAPNLIVRGIADEWTFPHRAGRDHYSAWGNRAIAETFLAALEGGGEIAPTRIETHPLADAAPAEGAGPALSSYDWVELRLGGAAVGIFVTVSEDTARRGKGGRDSFRGKASRALLAISTPGSSLVDAAFVPVAEDLPRDARLMLRVETPDGEIEQTLGRVRRVDPRAPLYVVEAEGLEFRFQRKLQLHGGRWLDSASRRRGDRVSLWLGGSEILAGQAGERTLLSATRAPVLKLAPSAGHYVDPDALGDSGTLDLVLAHPGDGMVRVPIADWTKRPAAPRQIAQARAVAASP
jgi:hypothetical protein